MTEKYNVIGLMSGTSMDGLDIAYCEFEWSNGKWSFEINEATTVPYSKAWLEDLNTARLLSKADLKDLAVRYGKYLAQETNRFITEHKIEDVDFIASHGHTVHHQPEKGITVQIGDGAIMSLLIKKTVVCDFRTQDVKLGGQGAPLVPIGDKLLFSEWDACLNLGGFANISFDENESRLALDICPANIVLNYLTRKLNLEYDDGGAISETGALIPSLLKELNSLVFYSAEIPKSLGIEWVEKEIYPRIEKHENIPNVLHTLVAHITSQIASIVNTYKLKTLLVTGGGAFNTYLISQLRNKVELEVVISTKEITDYKEALVFAFLGVLKIRGEVNALKSVTGAKHDHSSGVIFNKHD